MASTQSDDLRDPPTVSRFASDTNYRPSPSRDPLQVACPTCGAQPGQLCIRMSHKTNAHFARWRVIWAQAKATR